MILKPPTNLKAVLVGKDRATLTWVDNSNRENGFKIHRKINNGPWVPGALVPRNTMIYTEEMGLAAGTMFTYRIRAEKGNQVSAWSNEASVTTPLPTPIPTPDPVPTPTPDPVPVPDPVPIPTPDPIPVPDPVPTPGAWRDISVAAIGRVFPGPIAQSSPLHCVICRNVDWSQTLTAVFFDDAGIVTKLSIPVPGSTSQVGQGRCVIDRSSLYLLIVGAAGTGPRVLAFSITYLPDNRTPASLTFVNEIPLGDANSRNLILVMTDKGPLAIVDQHSSSSQIHVATRWNGVWQSSPMITLWQNPIINGQPAHLACARFNDVTGLTEYYQSWDGGHVILRALLNGSVVMEVKQAFLSNADGPEIEPSGELPDVACAQDTAENTVLVYQNAQWETINGYLFSPVVSVRINSNGTKILLSKTPLQHHQVFQVGLVGAETIYYIPGEVDMWERTNGENKKIADFARASYAWNPQKRQIMAEFPNGSVHLLLGDAS